MKTLREAIIGGIHGAAEVRGLAVSAELTDSTVLLQSGLDSLGFAILVAQLEEDLGYDPFTMMDEPYYPRTIGEFVSVYERFAPKV